VTAADPRLVVIVPTRGRPHNIPPLIEAFDATTTAETWLQVAVDGDPEHQQDYAEAWDELALLDDAVYQLWIGSQRLGMCARLNNATTSVLDEQCDPTDRLILGFMGDDHRPRTVGWDQAIIDAMPPLGVVYCDDGFQGENLPTSVFMDAELVRRLGWMVPPGIGHLFCDNAWKALGEALGTLAYLPDVLIEHMHPHAEKAPMDAGYAEVNSARQWEADEAAFRRWLAADLARDVARVREVGE
jgi:hypothetical protein